MDWFWCSRCLNDRIEVPNMMRLFAGGTTTLLVVKIWTKQPWVKIEYLHNFDRDFALFRDKIWQWLFHNFFCIMVPKFYTKNFNSFQPKMKVWQWFSRILFSFGIGKINVTPSLCKILEPQHKKIYKIVIVKFCLYIVRNCNQSHANFQFFKV